MQEQISQELKFLLTVNHTCTVATYNLQEYLDNGYKILGVEQHKDVDGTLALVFVVGKHID